MFARLSTIFLFVAFFTFTVFASALPNEPASSCSSGNLSCCNTVEAASTPGLGLLLGLLGIVLNDLTVLVGLGCVPIDILAPTCSQQAVCCQNVYQSGLIVVGCDAVSL